MHNAFFYTPDMQLGIMTKAKIVQDHLVQCDMICTSLPMTACLCLLATGLPQPTACKVVT